MLLVAVSIGMLPYLKTNMISSVPNVSASSVARAMVWSGVPHGWEFEEAAQERRGVLAQQPPASAP